MEVEFNEFHNLGFNSHPNSPPTTPSHPRAFWNTRHLVSVHSPCREEAPSSSGNHSRRDGSGPQILHVSWWAPATLPTPWHLVDSIILKVFSNQNDSMILCKVLTAPQVHTGFEIPIYCRLSVLISSDGPYNIGDLWNLHSNWAVEIKIPE